MCVKGGRWRDGYRRQEVSHRRSSCLLGKGEGRSYEGTAWRGSSRKKTATGGGFSFPLKGVTPP